MGFSIFSNGDKISYNIKNYVADTVNDLTNIPKSAPGSMVFIIENSTYYILNNKQEWIETETASSSGGIVPTGQIQLSDPSVTYDVTNYAEAIINIPSVEESEW